MLTLVLVLLYNDGRPQKISERELAVQVRLKQAGPKNVPILLCTPLKLSSTGSAAVSLPQALQSELAQRVAGAVVQN